MEKKSIMLRFTDSQQQHLERLVKHTEKNAMSKAITYAVENFVNLDLRQKEMESENYRLKMKLEMHREIMNDFFSASERLKEINED